MVGKAKADKPCGWGSRARPPPWIERGQPREKRRGELSSGRRGRERAESLRICGTRRKLGWLHRNEGREARHAVEPQRHRGRATLGVAARGTGARAYVCAEGRRGSVSRSGVM